MGAGSWPARRSHIPALFTYVWACGSYLSWVMSKTIIFLPHCPAGAVLTLANRCHCSSVFSLHRELAVVLNVNLPLICCCKGRGRENRRQRERTGLRENVHKKKKGWEEKKKRREGFKGGGRWGKLMAKMKRKTWWEWEAVRKRGDRVCFFFFLNKRVITMQRHWRRKKCTKEGRNIKKMQR